MKKTKIGISIIIIIIMLSCICVGDDFIDFSFDTDIKEEHPQQIDFSNQNVYEKEKKEKIKEKTIKFTLQYSTDEDEERPLYIDTGIEVALNEKISFEKIEEFVKQITISKKGKIVEDDNKLLLLIDGKTRLLEGDKLTDKDIEKIFKEFSFIVKAQNSDRGNTFNIIDYLEIRKEMPIEINEEKIILTAKLSATNNDFLKQIELMGKALGAKVEYLNNNNEIVLTIDNKIIKVIAENNKILLNNKEYINDYKNNSNKRAEIILSLIKIFSSNNLEWDTKKNLLIL